MASRPWDATLARSFRLDDETSVRIFAFLPKGVSDTNPVLAGWVRLATSHDDEWCIYFSGKLLGPDGVEDALDAAEQIIRACWVEEDMAYRLRVGVVFGRTWTDIARDPWQAARVCDNAQDALPQVLKDWIREAPVEALRSIREELDYGPGQVDSHARRRREDSRREGGDASVE